MVPRSSFARLFPVALLLSGLAAGRMSGQLAQPNLRVVDSRNGLSHDQVNAMAMDARGYLWLGTVEGLNRFSGTRMKVYKSDGTSRTIPTDRVHALVTGADGMLYMGGMSGFLTLIDPMQDTMLNIPLPRMKDGDMSEARIDALYLDKEGRIWVGNGKHWLSFYRRGRTSQCGPEARLQPSTGR